MPQSQISWSRLSEYSQFRFIDKDTSRNDVFPFYVNIWIENLHVKDLQQQKKS